MTDVARYDDMMLSAHMRALYEDCGYYNVGDWSRGARALPAACERLVFRHADAVRSTLGARARFNGVVIDAGCGLGGGTALLASYLAPSTVAGINVSSRQVLEAARRYGGAAFCVMDATRIALADESATAIVSVEAAFHFNTRDAFLDGAYRVLKPGGCLVITDMLFATSTWVAGWSVPAANVIADLHAYAACCEQHGFEILSLDDVTSVTWEGFCAHLRARGQATLADDLEPAVRAYLFAILRKP